VNHSSTDFEVLGEKALPEGYVDIFIKLKHPTGSNKYLLVEVKTGRAQRKDIDQLRDYMRELGSEVVGGVLILDVDDEYTYENLLHLLHLEVVE